jgi:hypothetical protein
MTDAPTRVPRSSSRTLHFCVAFLWSGAITVALASRFVEPVLGEAVEVRIALAAMVLLGVAAHVTRQSVLVPILAMCLFALLFMPAWARIYWLDYMTERPTYLIALRDTWMQCLRYISVMCAAIIVGFLGASVISRHIAHR